MSYLRDKLGAFQFAKCGCALSVSPKSSYSDEIVANIFPCKNDCKTADLIEKNAKEKGCLVIRGYKVRTGAEK